MKIGTILVTVGLISFADVVEWNTQSTQNAPRKHVGSSPIVGTKFVQCSVETEAITVSGPAFYANHVRAV